MKWGKVKCLLEFSSRVFYLGTEPQSRGQHTDHCLWFNLCSEFNSLSSSSTSATSEATGKSHPPLLADRQVLSVQLQTSHFHGRRTEALARTGGPECWLRKANSQRTRHQPPVRGRAAGHNSAPQEVNAKSGQEAEMSIPPASPWVRRHPPRAFQAEVNISIYGLQHIIFSSIFTSNCIFYRTYSLSYLNIGFNYPRKYLLLIFL